MSKPSLVVLLVALGAIGCKTDKPTQTPTTTAPTTQVEFDGQVRKLLDEWFAARPVTATALGEHRHDGAWPDLSTAGLDADRKRIDRALTSIAQLAKTQLDPDERIDLDILRAEIELQQFGHDVEQPWRRDPLWSVGSIGSGIEDLVSREYAPADARGQSVASRLEGLPKLCDQIADNLVAAEAYAPHTQVAIAQIDGIVTLIEQVVQQRLEQASAEVRGRISAATPAAVAALRALQQTLQSKILPGAQGNWRLGQQNFERKLALTLQSNIPAVELRRVAVVEHGRVRKRMAELAYDLAPVLFSASKLARIKSEAAGDPDTAVVRAVLEELAVVHATPEGLRDAVEASITRLSAFVSSKHVVTTDADEVLQVIWTPPHQRGVFVAGLAAPGPLEATAAGLPSFYLVQPVPPEWPEEQRESLLREYNDFMLEILSIHEAIPGHFVQSYFAKREDSLVRKVLANGPFVEGWAVYAEKVMIDAGYPGAPPLASKRPRGVSRGAWKVATDDGLRAKAIALHGLKFYLRSVTNAILDYGVHAGDMGEDEAIELMVERSFQQEGEARGKWIRAQVTATQLSTYFVGAQAWLRVRAHAEARARDSGKPFDMAAFHDAALSHGAPPVHRLPILLGWGEAAANKAAAEPGEATPAEATTSTP